MVRRFQNGAVTRSTTDSGTPRSAISHSVESPSDRVDEKINGRTRSRGRRPPPPSLPRAWTCSAVTTKTCPATSGNPQAAPDPRNGSGTPTTGNRRIVVTDRLRPLLDRDRPGGPRTEPRRGLGRYSSFTVRPMNCRRVSWPSPRTALWPVPLLVLALSSSSSTTALSPRQLCRLHPSSFPGGFEPNMPSRRPGESK